MREELNEVVQAAEERKVAAPLMMPVIPENKDNSSGGGSEGRLLGAAQEHNYSEGSFGMPNNAVDAANSEDEEEEKKGY